MWVVYSDFSQGGSGYSRIMQELCNRLVTEHGVSLTAMGLGYNGEQHDNDFRIVPCRSVQQFPQQVGLMLSYGVPISGLLVAADVPIQSAFINAFRQSGVNLPYVGFFPIESGPVCQNWLPPILGMTDRIVMSKHAQDALQAAGCSSHFVPIGSPPGYEPLEDGEIIKQYRNAMGVQDDEFMILTVADNQERKNLAAAFEIVANFSTSVIDYSEAGFATDTITKNKVKWVLVTRPDSPVGWDLNDLAMRMGIMDKISIVSRGIEDDMLIGLYQAADCFLLTSKAEGLAMPVLEAMATRTPVIGTNISAIAEHLGENDIDEARGYLLDVDFAFIDCYGNGERAMVSVDDGVNAMSMVYEDWQLKRYNDQNNGDYVDTLAAHEHMLNMAQEYVMSRTWGNAAAQFAEIIKQYTPPVLEIEPEPEIKEVAHG